MGTAASLAQLPPAVAPPPTAIVPDADFDVRWAAWVARGRLHDERVRRRFQVWLPVIAIGAAIALARVG